MGNYVQAALRLHAYVLATHWSGEALLGPDPGIRINYRLGRFVKSYLSALPWRDDYYYLQGQGYWVLGNWQLMRRTGDRAYREIATRCSASIVARQRLDGAWDYPNPEWKGRVATAEGTWAALGLLESYRQTGDPAFLSGALAWHRYVVDTIGFQRAGDELAVNYFANRTTGRVPNNTALVLRFVAELAGVTGEKSLLQPAGDLLTFMQRVQRPAGEMPYRVEGVAGGAAKPHFQCYQYNAFQLLDLARYYELTRDPRALDLVSNLVPFLQTGIGADGHAFYQCGVPDRAVTYHSAVLGAAFARAGQLGMHGYEAQAERAYRYVLGLQRRDGGFLHSRRDYRVLSDRRSYPRYLAMILLHLLQGDEWLDRTDQVEKEEALTTR